MIKAAEQWVWLALDVETREIVGCYIGVRSKESAQAQGAIASWSLSTVCGILQ